MLQLSAIVNLNLIVKYVVSLGYYTYIHTVVAAIFPSCNIDFFLSEDGQNVPHRLHAWQRCSRPSPAWLGVATTLIDEPGSGATLAPVSALSGPRTAFRNMPCSAQQQISQAPGMPTPH